MNLRINVLRRPHTEAFVVGLEDLRWRVLDVLKLPVAAPLAERAGLAALDEQEAVEAVVAAALAPLHLVLLAEGAIAVHLVSVLVKTPEKIKPSFSKRSKLKFLNETYLGENFPSEGSFRFSNPDRRRLSRFLIKQKVFLTAQRFFSVLLSSGLPR